jgi:hypothetical protein
MSRRGNGLSADTYAPLTDLTPELADMMLTALREAGIAAYASPSDLPDTQTASEPAPARPLDRLYVDTSMRSTAESVLHLHLTRLRDDHSSESDTVDTVDTVDTDTATLGAGAGADRSDHLESAERDDDAVWAEIVASFEAAPEGGVTPWPDEENLDEEDGPSADDADDADTDPEATRSEGEDRTGRLPAARVIKSADPSDAAPTEDGDDADDEDHYIPPPPPPLPDGDMVSRAAWTALLGGPVYLLLTVLLGWEVPGWAAFLAVAAFIGGFVTLVLRMGDDPHGPDDGAVV